MTSPLSTLIVCSCFLRLISLVHFGAKRYILQQKCMNGQMGTCLLRNTLAQLLALYTDSESHNAQHYGHTDDRMLPIADHTVYSSMIG